MLLLYHYNILFFSLEPCKIDSARVYIWYFFADCDVISWSHFFMSLKSVQSKLKGYVIQ